MSKREGNRVVAYLRVSTEIQEQEGASLPAQESAVRDYASRHSLEIVETIREQVSGTIESLDRPELQRALGKLADGDADGILVWNLDRFSRNVRDAAGLLEDYFGKASPWRLISVTEELDTRTAGGRLQLHIMLSVHQYEAERIGERIRAVKKFLASQGFFAGGEIPFGFRLGPKRDDGRALVPDREEQKAVVLALALRKKGSSLRRIAGELEARGHLARSGRRFYAEQIARILRNAPVGKRATG